jgi:hypothetical protein
VHYVSHHVQVYHAASDLSTRVAFATSPQAGQGRMGTADLVRPCTVMHRVGPEIRCQLRKSQGWFQSCVVEMRWQGRLS